MSPPKCLADALQQPLLAGPELDIPGWKIAMNPSYENDTTPWSAHTVHLAHELRLVRYVLATLQGPDQVEGIVFERQVQGISDLRGTSRCATPRQHHAWHSIHAPKSVSRQDGQSDLSEEHVATVMREGCAEVNWERRQGRRGGRGAEGRGMRRAHGVERNGEKDWGHGPSEVDRKSAKEGNERRQSRGTNKSGECHCKEGVGQARQPRGHMIHFETLPLSPQEDLERRCCSQPRRLRQFLRLVPLLRAQRDACGLAPVLPADVPRGATDATTHIQHILRGSRAACFGDAGPPEDLLDHLHLARAAKPDGAAATTLRSHRPTPTLPSAVLALSCDHPALRPPKKRCTGSPCP